MHGKIAFEEHFNLPQFEIPRFYGDPQAMAEVDRRLAVNEQRLADMDATGIDYAILSLTAPSDLPRRPSQIQRATDSLFPGELLPHDQRVLQHSSTGYHAVSDRRGPGAVLN
jgi:hypothetical protein